jgi:membrane-bound inhibitor of C-type lysozyme
LDAGTKTDAVFIFRTPGALTTVGASKVILAGGARYNNIYWSTGTAAHFDSGTIMEGTIFAGTNITYAAHCTHHGRYKS